MLEFIIVIFNYALWSNNEIELTYTSITIKDN